MCAAFLLATVFALTQGGQVSLRFWSIISAGEVAAWRLKWLVVPAAIVALWGASLLSRSIKNSASRFGGLRLARAGFVASAAVTLLVVTLIGITIPERLRQRQMAIDSEFYAQAYTIQLALLDYRDLHGTLPSALADLKELPDPNGAIAAALSHLDPSAYKPSAVLASATKPKPRSIRVGAFPNSPTGPGADAMPGAGISFTNYDVRLPGEDKVLGTDDDLIMHDGMIMKVSELPPASSSAPARPTRP